MIPCSDFALHSLKGVFEELQVYLAEMEVDPQKKGSEEVLLDCYAEHYQSQEVSSAIFSYAMTFHRQTRNPRLATLAGWEVGVAPAVL